VIAASPPQPPQTSDAYVRTWLRDQMGFSDNDIRLVNEGHAVARQLTLAASEEVSVFGAVRIAASPGAFIEQLRDIQAYERRLGVLQVGKFHDPPRLEDLDGLTLDRADLQVLEHCRPADCDLQLSAAMMDRFATDVPWNTPGAFPQANRLFRQMLFDRCLQYQTGGLEALEPYDDGPTPMPAAEEFRRLQVTKDLLPALPHLAAYVTGFPASAPPGVEDFYYWNMGEFGMKPTTRLNHVSIYPVAAAGARPDGIRFAIATTQIYSTHYFSATFELRTVVDDAANPGQGFYLCYASRSRVSGLTSFIGTLIRPIVRSRARSGMERYLTITKSAVERREQGASSTVMSDLASAFGRASPRRSLNVRRLWRDCRPSPEARRQCSPVQLRQACEPRLRGPAMLAPR
jgi:hypothetical protein